MPGSGTMTSGALALGLIMLDTAFPRIPGDVGNTETFSFPVVHSVVPKASPYRVVIAADPALAKPFVQAARELEADGVCAIGTSCGFLVLFQERLAEAVQVPVLTSSLLQVPMLQAAVGSNGLVGILTARAESLRTEHLLAAGADPSRVVVGGLDRAFEFNRVFLHGGRTLNEERCRKEVVTAAATLARDRRVRALVLECTNLPPYAGDIRQATGLPVYDVCTLLNSAYAAVVGPGREPL